MGRVFFLRKTRSFNKSRYARNRQLARVIFYFSLFLNILIIYGAFIGLYGFVFKFNHDIWVLYILFASFIIPSLFRISKRYNK